MLLLRSWLFSDRLLLLLLVSHGLLLLLRLRLALCGSLLCRLLLLGWRRLRIKLVVVVVTAADERECRRADTCGGGGTQKHAPRHAEVGKRGQREGQSRGWSAQGRVSCNKCE